MTGDLNSGKLADLLDTIEKQHGLAIRQKTAEHLEGTGKFILFNTCNLRDSSSNELPEADLTFQDGMDVYQYIWIAKGDMLPKTTIKPGAFVFADKAAGLVLEPTNLKPQNLLESVVNTGYIANEMKAFFNKLDTYREMDLPLARKILVHSPPGYGKTTAIFSFCIEEMVRDPGTVVVTWPTSSIRTSSVLAMLDNKVKYAPECTKMVIVMEDLGGGQREGDYSPRSVDAALLEFLDGGRNVFKIPTFVVATTNNPENLAASLADRPGRFDKVVELQPPSHEERVSLLRFILKREITPEEAKSLDNKKAAKLSIAHLKEIAIRHRLYDMTIERAAQEVIEHSEKFKNSFEDKKSLGLGGFS